MLPVKPRAVVAIPITASDEAQLAAVAEIEKLPGAFNREDLLVAVADAQALLCVNNVPVNAELLDAGPKLRVVSGFGVGYDRVDVPEATGRGVAICNTPGVLNAAVADLTLGLILAAARHIIANHAYVVSGGWATGGAGRPGLGFDLADKTLGIIGFGRIGQAVAERARVFGMEVVYYDLVDPEGRGHEWCRRMELPELLERADIVSLHVNLSEMTRHMLSTAEFARMKPTAWVVNTSRGPVIDQAALTAALRGGEIAGAALDVVEVEPPAADEPLFDLPNVIVLPHVGSATVETRNAMRELVVANAIAVLRGEAPPACVNPEVLE